MTMSNKRSTSYYYVKKKSNFVLIQLSGIAYTWASFGMWSMKL